MLPLTLLETAYLELSGLPVPLYLGRFTDDFEPMLGRSLQVIEMDAGHQARPKAQAGFGDGLDVEAQTGLDAVGSVTSPNPIR
jgi:hypothetical protein